MEEFIKMEAEKVERAFGLMTDAVEGAHKSGLVKGLRPVVNRAKAVRRLMKAGIEDGYDYTQVLPPDALSVLKEVVRVASTYAAKKIDAADLAVVRDAIIKLGEQA